MAAKISTGQAAAAQAQASLAQAAAFYAAATERSIELPKQSYAAGTILNFNLPPSGIGTWVEVSFQGSVTATSGATTSQPTASPWYPYNLLSVSYVDYLGFTRCNASGWQLHLLEQIRTHQFDPSNVYGVVPVTAVSNGSPQISAAAAAYQFAAPVPTPVASGTSAPEAIAFSFVIPISLSKSSIKGSHLFNITGAQDVLSINCVAPTGGANAVDSPFTVPVPADTTVAVTGTVDVCYYYLDWPSGVQVPMTELALAHQVNSVTQNTNIIQGQLYQYLVPTGYVFYRFLTQFVNDGTPDTLDITQVSFYLDANTPIHVENLQSFLGRVQRSYGHSLPDGVFVTDLSTRPVNSNSYSQVAINLQLNNTITVNGAFMRTLADALTLQNQNLQALGAQG